MYLLIVQCCHKSPAAHLKHSPLPKSCADALENGGLLQKVLRHRAPLRQEQGCGHLTHLWRPCHSSLFLIYILCGLRRHLPEVLLLLQAPKDNTWTAELTPGFLWGSSVTVPFPEVDLCLLNRQVGTGDNLPYLQVPASTWGCGQRCLATASSSTAKSLPCPELLATQQRPRWEHGHPAPPAPEA